MEPNEKTNPSDSAIGRTRKSEIISGLSVLISIPCLAFAYNIWSDIKRSSENRNAAYERQMEQISRECSAQVEQEKQRAQEQERDIKADLRDLRGQIMNSRWRR